MLSVNAFHNAVHVKDAEKGNLRTVERAILWMLLKAFPSVWFDPLGVEHECLGCFDQYGLVVGMQN